MNRVLLVDDEARQGALRFAEREGGPFLAGHTQTRIPPFIELPRLLSAVDHVLGDTESDDADDADKLGGNPQGAE